MLTRTSEYALQALIHLTQNSGDWPISGKEIAEATGIPRKYLSKVLADLVRAGVLESARGKSGGFRMARPGNKTSLYEVLAPFEQFHYRRCPFANKDCSEKDPCLAHDSWKRVVETEERFLRSTMIHHIAVGRGGGKTKTSQKKTKRRIAR